MNIKNVVVERLAEDVARLAGETKTEAIRRALEQRRARLVARTANVDRKRRLHAFLETEVWPQIPRKERGRRLTKKQEEAILGLGKDGV